MGASIQQRSNEKHTRTLFKKITKSFWYIVRFASTFYILLGEMTRFLPCETHHFPSEIPDQPPGHGRWRWECADGVLFGVSDGQRPCSAASSGFSACGALTPSPTLRRNWTFSYSWVQSQVCLDYAEAKKRSDEIQSDLHSCCFFDVNTLVCL